jgi:membrane-bound lytic murein transglycosylase D
LFNAPSRRAVERKIYYVVRRGDSLARISQRFNVTVRQLVQWNGLDRGAYLQPGQNLTLYVDVTRLSESG